MKKILIVDDQREVRELVAVTLGTGNYKIYQASSGDEAVSMAKREKPDLIIMDLMMPGETDGLAATRKIKSDPETRACQVIMLTAKDQISDRDQAEAAGADDYFSKPFSPLELIRKIESVVGQ